MGTALKSRFVIPSLIICIAVIGIIRLCGLLVLRQKIFIEKNNICECMRECDVLKNKNLLLIVQLTDLVSPKMLREILPIENKHKRNLLINVSNWKQYRGSFLERNRVAMNSVNKCLVR